MKAIIIHKLLLCFTISAFAIGGTNSPVSAQDAANVEVDAIIAEPLSQTLPVIGRFVALQEGGVASRISAPVRDVLVNVGDKVHAGEPVVLLDPVRFNQSRILQAARVEGMRNALKTAQLELSLSKQELARLEKLKGSAAFSKARFDDKVKEVARELSEVSEAEASLVEARANLKLAQVDLQDTEIRAPYNGVIVETHTEAGAFVSAGASVVTMLNDEAMEVEADVPSVRLSGLPQGRVVKVAMPNGTILDSVVRAVIPVENTLTRTRAVRFSAKINNNLRGHIAVGETATVMIPVGQSRNIISVHKDAVMPSASGQFVYVVKDGKAAPQPVQLGESVGVRFEVLSGLAKGDKVVVKGNERLYPFQPVKYDGMPPATPAPDSEEATGNQEQSG